VLDGKNIGNGEFALSVYPASQPVFLALVNNGAIGKLITAERRFAPPFADLASALETRRPIMH